MAPATSFTKPKREKKNRHKRKELEVASNAPNISAKGEVKEDKKKLRLQLEKNHLSLEKVLKDASVIQNRDEKHKKKSKGIIIDYNEDREKPKKNNIITDARFVSAHSDPRFQLMPKRQAKVPIDSRFASVLSDRSFSSSSAPVDKRGKPSKGKEINPLLHYYLHEEEPKMDREVEENGRMQEEDKEEDFYTSSDGTSDKSTSSTSDEDEEDDEYSINNDLCQYLMATHKDTPIVELETHRLAVVNMDWDHIKTQLQCGM